LSATVLLFGNEEQHEEWYKNKLLYVIE